MNSLRFNPYKVTGYPDRVHHNRQFLGFIDMLQKLVGEIELGSTMIEIGSFMGESTFLFASTSYFNKIYSIDPYDGDDMGLKHLDLPNWDFIREQYKTNLRYFDFIEQIEDYSSNVIDKFQDKSIDFVYIDGNHSYDSVKNDIEIFLPKIKDGGIIGGHDYSPYWETVQEAVNETIGRPRWLFDDSSWLHKV
jgi:predicted O-methyltransferase YrrM